EPAYTLLAGLGLFGVLHPAQPFVAGQRGPIFPPVTQLRITGQDLAQIAWHGVYDARRQRTRCHAHPPVSSRFRPPQRPGARPTSPVYPPPRQLTPRQAPSTQACGDRTPCPA